MILPNPSARGSPPRKYRKQVEGLIACQRLCNIGCVMKEYVAQDRKHAPRLEALKKAQADLETMPKNSDAFRGQPGRLVQGRLQRWIRGQQRVESRPFRLEPADVSSK